MKSLILRILFAASLAIGSNARAADTSITALPAISTVAPTTVTVVVDVSGTPTTKKAQVSQLIDGLPAATGSTAGKMVAADKAKLDAATDANTNSAIVRRDASGNFSANVGTFATITGLASPSAATDAANKGYVDAAAAGLVIKSPARAGTTGSNITLTAGAPTTLDGLSLSVNDRVLVKDQTDNKQNGIYFVATLGSGSNGTWTRTTDTDTGAELVTGSYCFITSGTVNANAAYTMVTTGTITIGTSPIVWNLFSQVTQIQASNILGQIVAAQIQDAAINTAKFAAGLTPVEVVGTLPTSGNFTGRTVVLTTDGKLYRYTGGAFSDAVATVDLTGQITTTQVTDNAITTAKVNALAITAGKIATNAVTAGTIAANAVTSGTIVAGAVSTAELAAGAVNASKIAAGTITANEIASNAITAAKIQAGTITADKLTISSLSAISANIGTITAGTVSGVTITGSTISASSGLSSVTIDASGLTIASGRITMVATGSNPRVRVNGTSTYASHYVEMNGSTSSSQPFLLASDGVGSSVTISSSGLFLGNSKNMTVDSGSTINGPGDINMNADSASAINISAGENGSAASLIGYWKATLNGRTVKIPIYNP